MLLFTFPPSVTIRRRHRNSVYHSSFILEISVLLGNEIIENDEYLLFRGIAKAGEPNNLSPVSPGVLYMDPSVHGTLRRKQRRLSRENTGVLEAIRKGANLAIQECQYQFRNRWWNCSTKNFLRGKNLFGKIVDRGESEIIYTYVQIMFYHLWIKSLIKRNLVRVQQIFM